MLQKKDRIKNFVWGPRAGIMFSFLYKMSKFGVEISDMQLVGARSHFLHETLSSRWISKEMCLVNMTVKQANDDTLVGWIFLVDLEKGECGR